MSCRLGPGCQRRRGRDGVQPHRAGRRRLSFPVQPAARRRRPPDAAGNDLRSKWSRHSRRVGPRRSAGAAERYRAAGIHPPEACAGDTLRCYPLGGVAFHVVGDSTSQTNWAARNSSFLERDSDAVAQRLRRSRADRGGAQPAHRRDRADDQARLPGALPLLRSRYRPSDPAVQALLTRDRNVHSSIDARLQMRAAAALRSRIESGGYRRGAAVVLDVETGDVLASVSYPWPRSADLQARRTW